MVDYPNIEFLRRGYGMIADLNEKDPGAPVCFPRVEGGRVLTGYCTCRRSERGNSCSHFSELVKLVREVKKKNGGRDLWELFAESMWYRLGILLSEGDATPASGAQVKGLKLPSGSAYLFSSKSGAFLTRLLENSEASLRFIERTGIMSADAELTSRADLIQRLASNQRSAEEKLLNEAGGMTRRQAAEQSFWGRLAYHAFREYGKKGSFRPAVDHGTGNFILSCFRNEKDPVLEMAVPRTKVRKVLAFLQEEFPGEPGMTIHPIPLKSIFRVTPKTKLDLEVRPAIRALQETGEARFIESKDLAKFHYGDLVYIKEMNILAEMERPGSGRRFTAPISMRLKKSLLPAFINEHRAAIEEGSIVLSGSLRNLNVFREFDRLEITLDALKRSWYWLSARYGFGDQTVSLADVIQAKREGKSYIPAESGWVDVNSEAFRALDIIGGKDGSAAEGKKVRFSAADLLRLMASFEKPIEVKGESDRAEILKRLLALAPAKPWKPGKGIQTPLRPYQLKGVDWLRFLFENGLAGLLCDEMGLGKTHQAMALMAWIKEKQAVKEPFLVVCPTTVISHWSNKIRDHAPRLKATVYHGGGRELRNTLKKGEVLLTSYGILRNDIAVLRNIPFSLAVFDEIQNLKNRDTLSHKAAGLIRARMRLGLTGTPVENRLSELKALFDLVLPGYLSRNEDFDSLAADVEPASASVPGFRRLKRLIAPFTLRRLKEDVLEELPEKIEDIRTCRLSEIQAKLYREALATKANPLLEQLESGAGQLPYIHIFALLNHLKRICDHPALALNKVEKYQDFESGKWELFQELLYETLDSGQKAVVFSQYLGMLEMMESLLQSLGIGYVKLTGASRERGEIVRRFNEDDGCRVFLGSLKAGGAGIDLLGGSTVLHFDRWWNAAREDQATDRVHRIGQRRVVQVFKIITEGTLEEKIAAIIEKKRRLLNSVVQADNPELSKIFTREELIDLLRM
ncbi:MAG: DEAD/DEAH box helicase [Acidobacteria bacterium]|nr:DEAD/DEAH box helicase [Acidobacteriota bacterium]